MAKQSVLQRPIRTAHLPRNSFDRGYRMNYAFNAGQLLPTFCAFVEAGSHCKLNVSDFLRTAEVNTAAFTIMDYHTEFFAVPIRQLMSTWGVFRTRVNDIHSTKFSVPNVRIPAIKTSEIYSALDYADGHYTDAIGANWSPGAVRLLDLLGYGITVKNASDKRFDQSFDVNPFYLCAYQKIYFDHFRNNSYEKNQPEAYNLDQFINFDGTVNYIGRDYLQHMLKLRYVDYRKDFISNVYPSLYYVNAADTLQGVHIPNSVLGLVNPPYSEQTGGGRVYVANYKSVRNGANTGVEYASGTFTTQTIRAAFAVDKLLRLSAYAPQHVVDQLKVRFGVSPLAENLNESIRLGSYKHDIIIGEVTSTATTGSGENGYLGAIGGKGIGSSDFGKTISYDAKEDCIIIAVSYVLPRITYDSLSLDAFNFKFVPEDYVVPEFMDLGLQPLYRKQLGFQELSTAYATSNMNDILGYQPRYSEYKLGVDKNHGAFLKGEELDDYVTHSRTSIQHSTIPSSGLNYPMLKCNPADLNSIFVSAFQPAEGYEQFFGTLTFAFACVQNLSVHGESNL